MSALTLTGSTQSAARARTASASPRSASTGGWMPRTRSRSSPSALLEASLASDSNASAACGSVRISAWAVLMVMPIATRRPWVPSWRSRSRRRSSAADDSRVSCRVRDSCCIRAASRVRLFGPSAHRANRLYALSSLGAQTSVTGSITSRPTMAARIRSSRLWIVMLKVPTKTSPPFQLSTAASPRRAALKGMGPLSKKAKTRTLREGLTMTSMNSQAMSRQVLGSFNRDHVLSVMPLKPGFSGGRGR